MLTTVGQFTATINKTANLEEAVGLIEQASGQGSELIVLPENAMYTNRDAGVALEPHAERLDGSFANSIARRASENRIAVVVGMTESPHERGSKPANTVLAIDTTGRRIGAYRKVHLYDAFGYRESDRLRAHEPATLTFRIGDLTFGVMTCYDLRFPEMARSLVDAGANVLLIPSAWAAGPAKEDHWLTLCRARAIENTVYVMASGQTGPACIGQSVIVDPMGVTVASAGEVRGIASARLSRVRVDSVRTHNPSLENRKFTIVPVAGGINSSSGSGGPDDAFRQPSANQRQETSS